MIRFDVEISTEIVLFNLDFDESYIEKYTRGKRERKTRVLSRRSMS